MINGNTKELENFCDLAIKNKLSISWIANARVSNMNKKPSNVRVGILCDEECSELYKRSVNVTFEFINIKTKLI